MRTEKYYYQAGTMDKPDSGEARGFSEQWQAEQYLDENREHAVAAARHSDKTQVARVYERATGRLCAIEYVHGTKPDKLRLALGDYDAVCDVGAVDGLPYILSGVFDDRYHEQGEYLTDADVDALNALHELAVAAYYTSLRFPSRATFERTDRPRLHSPLSRKERA